MFNQYQLNGLTAWTGRTDVYFFLNTYQKLMILNYLLDFLDDQLPNKHEQVALDETRQILNVCLARMSRDDLAKKTCKFEQVRAIRKAYSQTEEITSEPSWPVHLFTQAQWIVLNLRETSLNLPIQELEEISVYLEIAAEYFGSFGSLTK